MKKISITAAALLVATGTAFAGSGRSLTSPRDENLSSSHMTDQGSVTIDNSYTSSIPSGSSTYQDQETPGHSDLTIDQYGQGNWGH